MTCKEFRMLWNAKMTPARMIFDLLLGLCVIALCWLFIYVLWRPGVSARSGSSPLSQHEKLIEKDLKHYINKLSVEIGERNYAKYAKLQEAANWLGNELRNNELEVREQEYIVDRWKFRNVEVEVPGKTRPEEIIVVGAHYDTAVSSPGADDNGTGTAAVLELAKLFARKKPDRTIRFVLFSTEEPPFFSSKEMGSYFYADRCVRRNENVVAMLNPETLGYYSDAPESQKYPSKFVPGLPTKGNFIVFVSNMRSRPLVDACVGKFRDTTPFPSEGVAAPEWISGIDLADHYWFLKYGHQAVMITDTAPYRNPHYHSSADTADKLNFPAFARVVGGLEQVLQSLADEHTTFAKREEPVGINLFDSLPINTVDSAL
jgi:Zn-dependent M28 family amino/carboxypeptidase